MSQDDGEEQREMKILNFQAITGVDDLDYCRRRLESFNWDFEAAVIDTLNGSPAHSSQSSPTTPSSYTPNQHHLNEQQPRASRQREQQPQVSGGGTGGVISKSFNWLFNLIWPPSTGQDQRQQQQQDQIRDPEQAVIKFIGKYELLYGLNHPEFFNGSYSRALDKAKRDLLFMVVYLHSAEHDDTATFCRRVLNEPEFSTFLAEKNSIVWGGDVSFPEAYQASDILGASKYPFMALICLKNGRMQVAHRIEGALDLPEILQQLSRAVEDHGAFLVAERAERSQRDFERRLRDEQDAAYRESLRRDQEKERLRLAEEQRIRDEAEKLERLSREREQRLKNRELMIREMRETLPEEPQTGQISKIVFRLPDGSRTERKFLADEKVQILYQFAATLDLKIENDFRIVSNFPRKVFDDLKEAKLTDCGLYPTGMVVVEEIYNDDQ